MYLHTPACAHQAVRDGDLVMNDSLSDFLAGVIPSAALGRTADADSCYCSLFLIKNHYIKSLFADRST